jgi:hypothetical protein
VRGILSGYRLGLLPGTRVVFDVVGNSVRIRKADEQRRGAALVERMRAAGRRAAGPRMTTDEILALTRGKEGAGPARIGPTTA